MKRYLLQLLALAPLPIVLVLVVWQGHQIPRQPEPIQKPVAAKPASKADRLQLPPRLPSGWQRSGKEERYDKQTLFDRIDGAAPAYLKAGFVSLLSGEYKRSGIEEPVVVDCYDMGRPSQALGIYSSERDLSYDFLDVGQEGYRSAGTLNFWQGRFYVKLAGYGEGEAMDKAMAELASDLAAILPGPARETALELLKRLPTTGKVPHSEGYTLPALGDLPGLEGAYFASYGEPEARYQLFILSAKDPAAAKERLAKLIKHAQTEKTPLSQAKEGDLQSVTLGHPARGLILQKGVLLAGALDLPQPDLIAKVKTLLQASLSEVL